jgi:hypothetical protein
MNKKQKETILDCFVILKGGYNLTNMLEKTDAEILDILVNICLETNEEFWHLVDENTKLKERIKLLEY